MSYAFSSKLPLDATPYPRDGRSRPLPPTLPDGGYIYVRNTQGIIFVLPDGPHLHPRVLGGGAAASYAGDFTIDQGQLVDLTNLSGTFQCDDPNGLLAIAEEMRQIGLMRFFPTDGSPPTVLG